MRDLHDLVGENHPFRQISRSLWEMAIITGIVVRLLHTVFSAHGVGHTDWHGLVGRFVVVPVVLLALTTVHLANYPVKQWLWRAPSFAAAEATVGALTSLLLILMGRELWGTSRATAADWPMIVVGILIWHVLVICLFALVLGTIVQLVRRRELTAEHKHTHLLTHPPTIPGRRHDDPTPPGA
jgi:hypothetical protein